jgi:hypothetical protein
MIDSNEVLARIEAKLYDLESSFNNFLNDERNANGLEPQAFEPQDPAFPMDQPVVEPELSVAAQDSIETTDGVVGDIEGDVVDTPCCDAPVDDGTCCGGDSVNLGGVGSPIDEPGEISANEDDEEIELDGETEEGEEVVDDLGAEPTPEFDSEEGGDDLEGSEEVEGGESEEVSDEDLPSGEGDDSYDTIEGGESDEGEDDDTDLETDEEEGSEEDSEEGSEEGEGGDESEESSDESEASDEEGSEDGDDEEGEIEVDEPSEESSDEGEAGDEEVSDEDENDDQNFDEDYDY